MHTALLFACLLSAAPPATQPASMPTAELLALRDKLTKELAAVKAELARRQAPIKLPAYHLEENAKSLDGATFALASKIKFGVLAPNKGASAWYLDWRLPCSGASILPLKGRVRARVVVIDFKADKTPVTCEMVELPNIAAGPGDFTPLPVSFPGQAVMRATGRRQMCANVYVAIYIGEVLWHEALWKPSPAGADYRPNDRPWWDDPALRVPLHNP